MTAIRSTLSAAVSTQIGSLQGRLEAGVQVKLAQFIDTYSTKCPTRDELSRVLQVLATIDNTVNQTSKRINSFNRIASRLNPLINSVTNLVRVLRLLPVPTAVLGVGVPIGLTNRYAELLISTTNYLQLLRNDQRAIQNITSQTGQSLTRYSQLRETLNSVLLKCVEDDPQLQPLLNQFQRDVTGLDQELGPDKSYRAVNGKDYFFEIIEDTQLKGPVPRRVAIAKDRTGVTILRGAPSFSSSTKVLIDELKLRIDRQLP